MKKLFLITAVLTAVGILNTQAAILAQWENNHLAGSEVSTTAGESASGGSYDAGLASAPVISRGAGAISTGYADTFAFNRGHEVSLTDAITNDRYITFTLDLSGGNVMSISSLDINITSQNSDVNFALFSSATGFSAGNVLSTIAAAGTDTAIGGALYSVDLSDQSALQNLSSALEMRFYYYGQASQWAQVGIGRAFNGDSTSDLVINGTLAPVPEPAHVALIMGVGAFGWIFYRRRRA